MSGALRVASISALTIVVWLLSAGVAAASDHSVIVRAYNTYGVPEHAVRAASRTVRQLLGDAGIDARWRDCRIVGKRARRDTDPCSDRLKSNELIVRVVTGSAIGSGDVTMALGDAFIDPATREGALATVYADRVAIMAEALRIDFGTMIGRAITHEIAHLLLGTLTHTAVGIMRATWRSKAVMTTEETDWLFTREQQAAMRLAVSSRVGAPGVQ